MRSLTQLFCICMKLLIISLSNEFFRTNLQHLREASNLCLICWNFCSEFLLDHSFFPDPFIGIPQHFLMSKFLIFQLSHTKLKKIWLAKWKISDNMKYLGFEILHRLTLLFTIYRVFQITFHSEWCSLLLMEHYLGHPAYSRHHIIAIGVITYEHNF